MLIYNSNNYEIINRLTGHTNQVYSLCFGKLNSNLVVSGGADRTLRLWDLTTNTCFKTIYAHSKTIITLSISKNDRIILSGGLDDYIKIHDALTFNCIITLYGVYGGL